MSQRHRQARAVRKLGREGPSAWDREHDHRRIRHQVSQDLRRLDPDMVEGVVLATPVRSTVDTDEVPVVDGEQPLRRKGSKRVWRRPFWKRRTQVRQERARLANGGTLASEVSLPLAGLGDAELEDATSVRPVGAV